MRDAQQARPEDVEVLLEAAALDVPRERRQALAEAFWELARSSRATTAIVHARPDSVPIAVFGPAAAHERKEAGDAH